MGGITWSEDELEYLRTTLPHATIAYVARELGRSEAAVRKKRYELNIPGYLDNTDLITSRQLRNLMGVGQYTLDRWQRLGLKSHKRNGYKLFDIDEAVEFFRTHQDIWKAKLVTDDTIFQGAAWYRDKAFNDRHYRFFFTESEKAKVESMRKMGYSIAEIARRTGRTYYSIYYLFKRKEKTA